MAASHAAFVVVSHFAKSAIAASPDAGVVEIFGAASAGLAFCRRVRVATRSVSTSR